MINTKKQSAYKAKVQILVDDIKKIISLPISKTEQSIKIMERLEGESILIPLEYVNSFMYTRASLSAILKVPFTLEQESEIKEDEKARYNDNIDLILDKLKYNSLATIDPSKIKEPSYEGDFVTIWGNSFGPYCSAKYFKENTFRIVWILKESYIEKDSYLSGDRGRHKQAEEYVGYFDGKFGNTTHDNILKLTRSILISAGKIGKDASEEDVLKHVCILEVNHFPGLAFQSTDSNDKLIGEWAEINKDLIKSLIAFYNPNIVIGGFTLGHFFPEGYRYDTSVGKNNKHGINHISTGIKECEKFEVLGFNCVDCTGGDKTKSFVFKTKEGVFLIDAYHPCDARNYNKKMALEEVNIIQEMSKHKNESGA